MVILGGEKRYWEIWKNSDSTKGNTFTKSLRRRVIITKPHMRNDESCVKKVLKRKRFDCSNDSLYQRPIVAMSSRSAWTTARLMATQAQVSELTSPRNCDCKSAQWLLLNESIGKTRECTYAFIQSHCCACRVWVWVRVRNSTGSHWSLFSPWPHYCFAKPLTLIGRHQDGHLLNQAQELLWLRLRFVVRAVQNLLLAVWASRFKRRTLLNHWQIFGPARRKQSDNDSISKGERTFR